MVEDQGHQVGAHEAGGHAEDVAVGHDLFIQAGLPRPAQAQVVPSHHRGQDEQVERLEHHAEQFKGGDVYGWKHGAP